MDAQPSRPQCLLAVIPPDVTRFRRKRVTSGNVGRGPPKLKSNGGAAARRRVCRSQGLTCEILVDVLNDSGRLPGCQH
jgi:hypothetical protein